MVAKKDTTPSTFPTFKKRSNLGLALAFSLAWVLLLYPIVQGTFDWSADDRFDLAAFSSIPYFVSQTTKRHSDEHFNPNNKPKLRHQNKSCGAELSVFKGREARLNHAIFQALAIKGPQAISQLQKQLRKQKELEGTYYASLTKRIRSLEKAGYIIQTTTEHLQGSKAALYELCPKAYLAAFLNYHNPEFLLSKVSDKDARIILSDLIQVFSPA